MNLSIQESNITYLKPLKTNPAFTGRCKGGNVVKNLPEKNFGKQNGVKTSLILLRDRIYTKLFNRLKLKLNVTDNDLLKQSADLSKTIRDLMKNLNFANGQIDKLNNDVNNANQTIADLKENVSTLNEQLGVSEEIIDDLQTGIEKAKNELESVIEAHSKGEVNPVLKTRLKEEIEKSDLDYDIMHPPILTDKPKYGEDSYSCKYEDIKIGTNNRAGMKEINIPAYYFIENFDFELPAGDMKIRKEKLKKLDEAFELHSNISEKYSDSLVWNSDKIARDLLQNFFDGHGQTLDGVRIKITPQGILGFGKFRVRIEGKSVYNYKDAILLGESTSHNNKNAAGNYGEGLKMVTLKLLTQNETPNVRVGSGNWEVDCNLQKDKRLDAEVMHYNIKPVDKFDGNFVEFETSDKSIINSILSTINRFYHSGNAHFKTPDFENELFGIKLLEPNEKGGIYIAGQRFEYNNSYDGLGDAALFIKQKIPLEKYDMTRDRCSLNSYDLGMIASWLANKSTLGELKQVVKCLERYADKERTPMETVLKSFLSKLAYYIKYKNLGAIKFPDNYYAKPLFCMDIKLLHDMKQNGYKLFPNDYEDLGMKSLSSAVQKARQHVSLEPDEIEKEKIFLLKKALSMFTNLIPKYFTEEELNTKIYLYDAKSPIENSIRSYDSTQAEAIIDWDNKKQLGFWIDKGYINSEKFGCVLENALHELSHKAGGDGTKEFGYELTNVNEEVLNQISSDPKIAEKLRIMNEIWEELSEQSNSKK